MKKVLIDTNIYSLAMRGDRQITTSLKKIDQIGFSTISIGQLLSGFKGGNAEIKNKEELNIFLDSPRVNIFSINVETADFYASILNGLRKNGTPIPTNDIWIVATAFQNGYQFFSKDKHFEFVHGLLRFHSE